MDKNGGVGAGVCTEMLYRLHNVYLRPGVTLRYGNLKGQKEPKDSKFKESLSPSVFSEIRNLDSTVQVALLNKVNMSLCRYLF